MGIRLSVIASKANYTNFLLCPENSECICGPSHVKTEVGSFIIRWIRRLERNAPVSMVFIQKNIWRWRRWEFNEITVQSSPHNNDSAEQLFSTKSQEMLNSQHYWLSSHFLHTAFSINTSRKTRNRSFSIDNNNNYYYSTYIFDIFFPLVPPGHSNEKPVVPRLEAIPALSFQPASAQREWEFLAQTGNFQFFWKYQKVDLKAI